jgi:putative acetyltransferase
MAQSLPKYALRPFLTEDTPTLASIFTAAIQELTGDDYGEAQQVAWAAAAADEDARRQEACELTLIATPEFASRLRIAEDNNHIDMLFVHPSVAGEASVRCCAMHWRSLRARAAPKA